MFLVKLSQYMNNFDKYTIQAFLSMKGSLQAIDFYTKAFGAKLDYALKNPDGSIAHSEIIIGDSKFGVAEENEAWGNVGAKTLGKAGVTFGLGVKNAQEFVDNAVKHGAKQLSPVEDQFYGHKSGRIEDPYGYVWIVDEVKTEMTPDQMQEAMDKWMESASDQS